MLGADAMEVDKPAPVFQTAVELTTERFGSMELFKEHMNTVKLVKLIQSCFDHALCLLST
jgi:hypothetical protein